MSLAFAPIPTATSDGAPADGTPRLLARIGGERFALPLSSVLELLEAPTLAPCPASREDALGTILSRGGRMTVWNPARLLGQRPTLPPTAVLVLQASELHAAIAVDAADDVVALAEEDVRAIPALDDPLHLVAGVARDAAGLITVLDVHRLVRALGAAGEVTA